jgi:NhaA family Na+:H+ antiporter
MNQLNQSGSRILVVISNFLTKEALSGILLFMSAILAMVIANSSWGEDYFHFLHIDIGVAFGNDRLDMSLQHWVNDFLMAIFFLLVGLEIKREVLFGELSSIKKASFPIVGAIGGMVVPVAIYMVFNIGGDLRGFGIPMATDIAFALGILLLFGTKAPLSLKIFLTSLAVIDDLGAVLVIAIFYTSKLNIIFLLYSVLVVGILFLFNRAGVKYLTIYLVGGLVLWGLIFSSGIHATIAGVLLAMLIPTRSKISSVHFLNTLDAQLYRFNEQERIRQSMLLTHHQQDSLEVIRDAYEAVQSPLVRLEHYLHTISAFFVMPLFAFINAGIDLGGVDFSLNPVTLGILLGLMVGKPIGVFGFTYLFSRLKFIEKPSNLNWNFVFVGAVLAGIGFTMSIFISNLAFDELLNQVSKISILIASLLMGVFGSFYMYFLTKK